jgi:fatty-acyl-CoA synthase
VSGPPPVVGDWSGRAATYWPERLALVEAATGRRFTYGELDGRAGRLAAWLDAAGIGRGERVGVLARNGVEVLDAFFACGKLGAVLVPFNWRLHPRELGELAARTRPAALLYEEAFREGAAAVAAAVAPAPRVVHLNGEGLRSSRAYGEVLRTPPLAGPVADLDAEDIACHLFTGGTTGAAKAAMVSYRMIAWNTLNTSVHELGRDDVTITHTPMFHTGGLLVYTVPLLVLGGTVVLMRSWDPDAMLELIGRERVTMFFCVPTQYQLLLASPRLAGADLSSLRFVTSGGAPLPVSLLERWRARCDVPFKQGFGMTEFGPGAFSMAPEHAVSKAGSIGRPNWFVSAAVVDEHGRRLDPGQVGELVLKGPSMFSGYFGDPRATAEAVRDGWFHTGDLARRDGDGFFFIVDRKKDMFVSGGENVYPAEVERAICEHPGVLMCAVVGVPDERWGEVGRAFVVPRDAAAAAAISGDALPEFLRSRLAAYKVPRSVQLVAELPLSPQGKVLKRLLRENGRAVRPFGMV